MPTYVYRREDGTTFEIDQRITEQPLKTCPTTDQPVSRIITGGAGLVFKGSGFYLTDYARKSGGEAKSTPSAENSDTPKSDTSSKPAEKTVSASSD